MYVYNFGCHNLNDGKIHMYFWDETSGSRGSQDIGTCLLKHIEKCVTSQKQVVAYSDTCGGQNRNINIALTLMKVTQSPQFHVNIIDFKFLLPGHSYLPNDRDFAQIEKQLNKKEFLFSPDDIFETIRKTGRKNKFVCTEMKHCDILALKQSKMHW